LARSDPEGCVVVWGVIIGGIALIIFMVNGGFILLPFILPAIATLVTVTFVRDRDRGNLKRGWKIKTRKDYDDTKQGIGCFWVFSLVISGFLFKSIFIDVLDIFNVFDLFG